MAHDCITIRIQKLSIFTIFLLNDRKGAQKIWFMNLVYKVTFWLSSLIP